VAAEERDRWSRLYVGKSWLDEYKIPQNLPRPIRLATSVQPQIGLSHPLKK
jgi:hypothetical protein